MVDTWMNEWDGFTQGRWNRNSVNVRDFIKKNYTLYDGDSSFLAPPTEATKKLWEQIMELSRLEREAGGVLDMDTSIVSTITSHGAGYLNKELEQIVGLQTDKPFKRSLQPFGGIRMAQKACENYGYQVDPKITEIFTKYRKTHNQGVFDAYTPEMRLARKSAIITGLPDAYGRGRIIGDYRRVALYGVDLLIEDKKHQIETSLIRMTSKNIRLREELADKPDSMIMQLAGNDPSKIDMIVFEKAVRANDPYSVALWDEIALRNAQAMGILINMLNPDKLILGTMAWAIGDLYMDPIRKYLPRFCWKEPMEACEIVYSALKRDIGSYAGIAAALNYLNEKEQA